MFFYESMFASSSLAGVAEPGAVDTYIGDSHQYEDFIALSNDAPIAQPGADYGDLDSHQFQYMTPSVSDAAIVQPGADLGDLDSSQFQYIMPPFSDAAIPQPDGDIGNIDIHRFQRMTPPLSDTAIPQPANKEYDPFLYVNLEFCADSSTDNVDTFANLENVNDASMSPPSLSSSSSPSSSSSSPFSSIPSSSSPSSSTPASSISTSSTPFSLATFSSSSPLSHELYSPGTSPEDPGVVSTPASLDPHSPHAPEPISKQSAPRKRAQKSTARPRKASKKTPKITARPPKPSKKDVFHIPRPLNEWIIFRIEYVREHQGTQRELSGRASDVWKAMTNDEKAPYVKKATEAKAQHKLDYPDYKFVRQTKTKALPKRSQVPVLEDGNRMEAISEIDIMANMPPFSTGPQDWLATTGGVASTNTITTYAAGTLPPQPLDAAYGNFNAGGSNMGIQHAPFYNPAVLPAPSPSHPYGVYGHNIHNYHLPPQVNANPYYAHNSPAPPAPHASYPPSSAAGFHYSVNPYMQLPIYSSGALGEMYDPSSSSAYAADLSNAYRAA